MVLVTVVEYPVTTLVAVETGVRKLLMTLDAMASSDVLMVLIGARRAPLAAREYMTSSNDESMNADGCSKSVRNCTTGVGSTLRNDHIQKLELNYMTMMATYEIHLRKNGRGLELLVQIGSSFRVMGNQNGDVDPVLTLAAAGSNGTTAVDDTACALRQKC